VDQENKSESDKKNLSAVLEALQNTASNFFYLIELETKSAKSSLKILGCSLLLMGLSLITAWFSLMIAFAFYLFSLGLNWSLSFLSLVILNIFFIGVVCFLIKKHTYRLTFPATRRQINKVVFKP
jgi:hypothetical protein